MKKKSVWENVKIILKRMGDAGSKIGESMENSMKSGENKENSVCENENKSFNLDEFIKKLPQ